MGHSGNMIVKYVVRQICVPLENSAYFADGYGVDSSRLEPDMKCVQSAAAKYLDI